MRIPRQPPLSLAQQLTNLRANPICAGQGGAHCGRLHWHYVAQPTALSRRYDIRIAYQLDTRPLIVVNSPNLLELADGRRIPHLYEQDPPRLCLYQPKRGEWNPRMLIDQTFVPWTALWLFYFEDWLITNEWRGGGEHPPRKPDEPVRQRPAHARR